MENSSRVIKQEKNQISSRKIALEQLREKYNLSIYKLVNIAIKNAIDELE